MRRLVANGIAVLTALAASGTPVSAAYLYRFAEGVTYVGAPVNIDGKDMFLPCDGAAVEMRDQAQLVYVASAACAVVGPQLKDVKEVVRNDPPQAFESGGTDGGGQEKCPYTSKGTIGLQPRQWLGGTFKWQSYDAADGLDIVVNDIAKDIAPVDAKSSMPGPKWWVSGDGSAIKGYLLGQPSTAGIGVRGADLTIPCPTPAPPSTPFWPIGCSLCTTKLETLFKGIDIKSEYYSNYKAVTSQGEQLLQPYFPDADQQEIIYMTDYLLRRNLTQEVRLDPLAKE